MKCYGKKLKVKHINYSYMTECLKSREENKNMHRGLELVEHALTQIISDKAAQGLQHTVGILKRGQRAIGKVREIRPAVLRFAQLMEQRLKENDHKSGWEDCTRSYLFHKMLAKTDKLEDCFLREDDPIKDAVDVANYAMMIADNSRRKYPNGSWEEWACQVNEAEAFFNEPNPYKDSCMVDPSPVEVYEELKGEIQNIRERVYLFHKMLAKIHSISADCSEEERVAAEALWGEPQKKVAGITITYTYRCGICGRTEEKSWRYLEGADLPKASLPGGWHWVNNVLVCDNHRIDVTVDGRMV
jgi:hypothetical protein